MELVLLRKWSRFEYSKSVLRTEVGAVQSRTLELKLPHETSAHLFPRCKAALSYNQACYFARHHAQLVNMEGEVPAQLMTVPVTKQMGGNIGSKASFGCLQRLKRHDMGIPTESTTQEHRGKINACCAIVACNGHHILAPGSQLTCCGIASRRRGIVWVWCVLGHAMTWSCSRCSICKVSATAEHVSVQRTEKCPRALPARQQQNTQAYKAAKQAAPRIGKLKHSTHQACARHEVPAVRQGPHVLAASRSKYASGEAALQKWHA
eukprot:1143638-Pelagomonas_calceolata.AAC.2